MDANPSAGTIAVDLGKTRCRIELRRSDGQSMWFEDGGHPGLASQDIDGAARVILQGVAALDGTLDAGHIGVGIAGALAEPDGAFTLAQELRARLQMPAAVTSDVVTAHFGALAGSPGVLLIAGTGAVAIAFDANGAMSRADGWGPELGDLGSGAWIGREAVRAVLAAQEGRAGSRTTALKSLLAARMSPDTDGIRWVAAAEQPASRLASFAPDVLAAAENGDEVARSIVDRALSHLSSTVISANGTASEPGVVVFAGGLTDNMMLRTKLTTRCTQAGFAVRQSMGTAIEGAHAICRTTDTPHERFIHRA